MTARIAALKTIVPASGRAAVRGAFGWRWFEALHFARRAG